MTRELPALPRTVHFVFRVTPEWEPFVRDLDSVEERLATDHWRFRDCPENWSLLTYAHLRSRGCNVALTETFLPGEICVASSWNTTIRSLPFRSYVVCCRGDGPRPEICEQVVVQSPAHLQQSKDHLVQHWPQPGLIPRDPSRGTRIRRVVYKGWDQNLWEPFRGDEFRNRLESLGLELVIEGKPEDRRLTRWNDYSAADVVLAVRDLTEADLQGKPPSKLVNAWLAGVPALLGPEPSYRHWGKPGEDYLEVRSVSEALTSLEALVRDPATYAAIVEKGKQHSASVDEDAVAEQWHALLSGPVYEGFRRWKERRVLIPVTTAFRGARFVSRAVQHRAASRRYRHYIDHGYRPVSGTTT